MYSSKGDFQHSIHAILCTNINFGSGKDHENTKQLQNENQLSHNTQNAKINSDCDITAD